MQVRVGFTCLPFFGERNILLPLVMRLVVPG
jgi:hypothetical protein